MAGIKGYGGRNKGSELTAMFSVTFTEEQNDEILKYCIEHDIYKATLVRKAVAYYIQTHSDIGVKK